MSAVPANSSFNYIRSCDLPINATVKIGTLEGSRKKPTHTEVLADPKLLHCGATQDSLSEVFVTCQVFSAGKPMVIPVQSRYKHKTTKWSWNEWLELPVKYTDLPNDALLVFTIYDTYDSSRDLVLGGTSIPLFEENGIYRKGMYDLKVWQGVPGDGKSDSTTPGLGGDDDLMTQLSTKTKMHRSGQMPKIDWMDRLTFREIENINEEEKKKTENLYLLVEFPCFHSDGLDLDLIHFEKEADLIASPPSIGEIVEKYDPGLGEENLIEDKHYRMTRGTREGHLEKDLKPNAKDRDRLNTLVSYPPTAVLTSEDKDLIWRFRFSLSSQKKALVKFLRSVQWKKPEEVKQAVDLLFKWSPMESEDALELLSSSFTHPIIRRYAVARLNETDDEDLLLYILQLVQALRYENISDISDSNLLEFSTTSTLSRSEHPAESTAEVFHSIRDSTSSVADHHRQHHHHHHQSSKIQDSSVMFANHSQMVETTNNVNKMTAGASLDLPDSVGSQTDLATFLISRACNNAKLANYFYWYLKVECAEEPDVPLRDPCVANMYKIVLNRFLGALTDGGKGLQETFKSQDQLLERIVSVMKAVAREPGNRPKKIEKLQQLLKERDANSICLLNFDPLPFPLDPEVEVKGIDAESASLFKSALMPSRLTFKTTTEGKDYVAIFKHGDDLRQDQLVLQIISLINKLLKKENLDLKLTPYKVLATSSKHGFVQCIDSTSIADILSGDGSILNYLKRVAPSDNSSLGVSPEVLDNYVKSCAGYCVITYLLGVGDRHYDNLLMTKTGKLFHIDFGFILGRDPKPMQPSMKLTSEMVEAMGGVGSDHFAEFKRHFYNAFLHLRRSSNLILNLFSLMVDANIPDIALEPDKTVKKVQDRFHLELNDEQAFQYLQYLINASMSATAAAFMEHMHKFTQYLRK